MNSSDAENRINQMIRFIQQEADEKAQSILEKAKQKMQKEKNKAYNSMREKIITEYENKLKQDTVTKKLEKSRKINETRLEIQNTRNQLLNKLKEELEQKLREIVKKQDRYRELLKSLVLQGLVRLLEKKVVVKCLKQDEDVIKQMIPDLQDQYKKFIKDKIDEDRSVEITLHPTENLKDQDIGGFLIIPYEQDQIFVSKNLYQIQDQKFLNPQINLFLTTLIQYLYFNKMFNKIFLNIFLLSTTLCTIHKLNDKNFEEFINGHNIVFLKVYASWCAHSKALQKPFEQLPKIFQHKEITFAEADGEQCPELKSRLNVHGYPNLFIFIEGIDVYRQYFGPVNEVKPIQDFLNEVLEQELNIYEPEKVQKFKEESSYNGYGLYCGDEQHNGFHNLHKAQKLVHDLKIYYVDDIKQCNELGVEKNQILFEKKSGLKTRFSDMDDFKKLKIFLKFAKFEIINKFDVDNVGECIGSNLPMLVYFNENDNREFMKIIDRLYPQIQNTFVIMQNRNKENFESEYMDMFGLKRQDLPALMIVIIHKQVYKFKFEQEFNIKNIAKFLNDFSQNKLQQHYISEDEPQENKHKLKIVTSNSVRDIILDKTKDKIFLFYTNTCNMCPEIVKLMEEIADEMTEDNLFFGKINVAKNEVANVTKPPTLAFFSREDPKKIDYYQGQLDKEQIVKFIQSKRQFATTDL